MSDTPRTDEKAVSHIGFYSCATTPADFSRQLEKELNASLENQKKTMERLVWIAGLLVRAVEIATLSVSDVKFSRKIGKAKLDTLIKEIQ